MAADAADTLLDRWLTESAPPGGPASPREDPVVKQYPAGRDALALSPADRAALVAAGIRRGRELEADAEAQQPGSAARRASFDRFARCVALLKAVLRKKTPLGEAGVREALGWLKDHGTPDRGISMIKFLPLAGIVEAAEDDLGESPPPADLRDLLSAAADRVAESGSSGGWGKASCDKYAKRLRALAARPPADDPTGEPEAPPEPAGETVTLEPDGFEIAAGDPLRGAHERWSEVVRAVRDDGRVDWHRFDPKAHAATAAILTGSRNEQADVVRALLPRYRYWMDPRHRAAWREAIDRRAARENAAERAAEELAPTVASIHEARKRVLNGAFSDLPLLRDASYKADETWERNWGRSASVASQLLDRLLRRTLPLDAGTLEALATELAGESDDGDRDTSRLLREGNPLAGFTKQVEAFAADHEIPAGLRDPVRRVAARAREEHSSYRPGLKYAVKLEAVLKTAPHEPPPARPEPTGPIEPPKPTVTLEPDGYKVAADDPLRGAQERLSAVIGAVRGEPRQYYHHRFEPKDVPACAAILALPKAGQADVVAALPGRLGWWTDPRHAADADAAFAELERLHAETGATAAQRSAVAAAMQAAIDSDGSPGLPGYTGAYREAAGVAYGGRKAWEDGWDKPAQVGALLLDRLLRRALPLDAAALHGLAHFLTPPPDPDGERGRISLKRSAWGPWELGNPALGLSKQVAAFVKTHGDESLTPALRAVLRRVAEEARRRDDSYRPLKKYAAALEDLAGPLDVPAAADGDAPDLPPEPEPAGPPVTLWPDDFVIAEDDPLRPVQELFTQYLRDSDATLGEPSADTAEEQRLVAQAYEAWQAWNPATSEAGAVLLSGSPADAVWVLVAGLARVRRLADREAEARGGRAGQDYYGLRHSSRLSSLLARGYRRHTESDGPDCVAGHVPGAVRCTARSFARLLEAISDARPDSDLFAETLRAVGGVQAAALMADAPAETRAAAGRVIAWARALEYYAGDAGTLEVLRRAAEPHGPPVLDPGEAWTDAARATMGAGDPAAWEALLRHCGGASAGKPAKKWTKQAETLIGALGRDAVRDALAAWFPLVDKPRTDALPPSLADRNRHILPHHADVLKGLVWCAPLVADDEPADLARSLTALAVSSYKKVPGVGPRLVKVGNAAVWALGELPGRAAVGQLAMLAVKVKFGTAQKQIEKALTAAADREGLPRDEIDELAVPSYGLEAVGVREEALGEFTARLSVTGTSSTKLEFVKPDGKLQKSVPAAVKRDFPDDLKELKAAAKDIGKMLPAQRDRIDALFTAAKTWDYQTWRERYADHPLVGTLARRLIWRFAPVNDATHAADPVAAVPRDGSLVDAAGEPVDVPEPATVSLWHPAGEAVEDVLSWRRSFEDRGESQPFKQAHREIYLLTDAERNTGTYSNRFAAHLVKQHQFKALAEQRGWRSTLRLLVDDVYPPPSKDLPAHGLRAEYWVEGAGDDYGTDTTDSGSFLYLATDQVRFHRIDAAQHHAHAGGGGYGTYGEDSEPVPLGEVPPLVLSEILRDADLFVGVAGVGNDPNWADAGPDGAGVRAAYHGYWTDYSFGDLSATAKTRRDVLTRLVPRLKIAGRCEVGEKFLVVRGDRRTYKIHLGSGNILMEPNDAYLCIVPTSAAKDPAGAALPFEGDRTLSVILSKALMLADDTKITDRTILSQL